MVNNLQIQLHILLLLLCLRVLSGERAPRAAPPLLGDVLLRVPRLHDRLPRRRRLARLHGAVRAVQDDLSAVQRSFRILVGRHGKIILVLFLDC